MPMQGGPPPQARYHLEPGGPSSGGCSGARRGKRTGSGGPPPVAPTSGGFPPAARPLTVVAGSDGVPRAVALEASRRTNPRRHPPPGGLPRRPRLVPVTEILDTWADVGAWWDAEPERVFWRVQLAGGGIVELCRDAGGNWTLYRVWD